jgi:hypothetical protein
MVLKKAESLVIQDKTGRNAFIGTYGPGVSTLWYFQGFFALKQKPE